ncbi:hypothetical protein [Methylorubrum thiocyanatum]|uniref:hypothetical protein n=1 Tax=Methylorubrum thiocyanatum TaxID=47958 RepID=UPI003F7DCE3F
MIGRIVDAAIGPCPASMAANTGFGMAAASTANPLNPAAIRRPFRSAFPVCRPFISPPSPARLGAALRQVDPCLPEC